jgi:N-methylhydantoinase A
MTGACAGRDGTPPDGVRVAYRVAVDVGGTFTDAVALVAGTAAGDQGSVAGGPPACSGAPAAGVVQAKVLTDPADASLSVMEALARLAAAHGLRLSEFLSRTDRIVHGTTLGLNALLQGSRVRVGLLTTEGFRDSLEFRRSAWSNQWDFRAQAPPLLVPRERRLGIPERVDASGGVVRPLATQAVEAAARRLRSQGVEAVAICFLFSFLHPEHEARAADILRDMLPDVFVTASHEVAPRVREYERTSTTVINAYLGPLVETYLARLEDRLRAEGWSGELRLMTGSGGCVDRAEVRNAPVRTLLSGPAGGALGASRLAEELGEPCLLVGDMGGTSFDVCTVRGGRVGLRSEGEVAGLPVMAPLLAVDSVGAGGGSVAAVGADRLLRVGPLSAGARPGPAAFGRGGERPTLTDALVVLGVLGGDECSFEAGPGSRPALDRPAAVAALEEGVGASLGLDVVEAALAVVRVAVAGTADALRLEAASAAIDPRHTPLLAVGGAFPPIAGYVARDVGAARVVIPDGAASFCAAGMLFAEDRFDLAAPWLRPGAQIDPAGLRRALTVPGARLVRMLARVGAQSQQAHLELAVQARYRGQHHELDIRLGTIAWEALADNAPGTSRSCVQLGAAARVQPGAEAPVLPADPPTAGPLDDPLSHVTALIGRLFHRRHEEIYGYAEPERSWEVVGLRLSATVPGSVGGTSPLSPDRRSGPQPAAPATSAREAAEFSRHCPTHGSSRRVAWLDGATCPTPVVAVADLTGPLAGPALVDMGHTTLAVPHGFAVRPLRGALELTATRFFSEAPGRAESEVTERPVGSPIPREALHA